MVSSSSLFGARSLFRGADSLVGLSSAAAGAWAAGLFHRRASALGAALRFFAVDFLRAADMGIAVMSVFTSKFENPLCYLHLKALFACIIYISVPLYVWGRFEAGRWAIFRLDLRSGNEVREDVSSSIVPLLCSSLGHLKAGPCKGSVAFRLDRSKAFNEWEEAGSPIAA